MENFPTCVRPVSLMPEPKTLQENYIAVSLMNTDAKKHKYKFSKSNISQSDIYPRNAGLISHSKKINKI